MQQPPRRSAIALHTGAYADDVVNSNAPTQCRVDNGQCIAEFKSQRAIHHCSCFTGHGNTINMPYIRLLAFRYEQSPYSSVTGITSLSMCGNGYCAVMQ